MSELLHICRSFGHIHSRSLSLYCINKRKWNTLALVKLILPGRSLLDGAAQGNGTANVCRKIVVVGTRTIIIVFRSSFNDVWIKEYVIWLYADVSCEFLK